MKKIVYILLTMLLVASLTACGNKATTTSITTDKETINGITKTVTTTVVGGETTEEVVYTDADGNVLDSEEGEAAFLAAKDSVAEEVSAEEEETRDEYTASLSFVNNSYSNIKELYLALASDESWGSNILADGYVFAVGDKTSPDDISVTYTPDLEFSMKIVTKADNEYSFNNFTFGNLIDPENATITLTYHDENFYILVS